MSLLDCTKASKGLTKYGVYTLIFMTYSKTSTTIPVGYYNTLVKTLPFRNFVADGNK